VFHLSRARESLCVTIANARDKNTLGIDADIVRRQCTKWRPNTSSEPRSKRRDRADGRLVRSDLFSWGPVVGLLGLALASAPSIAAPAPETKSLFDGRTFAGWVQSDFEGEGSVKIENPFQNGPGAIILGKGTTLCGIRSTLASALPRVNYEISLEAMRLEGGDFFCGLTFPVAKSACTFVVGGWGGSIVGLSSIDHIDASENETSRQMEFKDGRWYRIRVRVTEDRVQAWIDDEQMVDLETKGKRISLRGGDIQKSLPLGVATYMTRAALRDIRLRRW
jgi:hypothetical protein